MPESLETGVPTTKGWETVIAAVRTKWQLLALMVLAAYAVVSGLIFAKAEAGLIYMALAVLALLVVVVGAVLLRPRTESEVSPGTVTINLKFPRERPPINFVREKCVAKIFAQDGAERKSAPGMPTRGPGGWSLRLGPGSVRPTDQVQLHLVDSEGTAWIVPDFLPLSNTQDVIQEA